ncbi:hypothetical protein ABLN87_18655 [Ruegeria sp. SCPT10]|uniref:hypothetical protein n=1 Tax=Ruegeria sp. SCP10 TaxID=3141377 RepID=UPI003339D1E8
MNSSRFDRALWIIGRWKQLYASAIWSQFHHTGIPDEISVSFRSADINRTSIRASKIEEILDGAHVPSFEVLGDGFSFSYGQNAGQNYDHVFIKSNLAVLTPEFCDELISATLADDLNFTQAHLVDENYQYYQSICDPLDFKALGLSMEGLPMKSNGLPFPLEQQIVDTSQNPGRYRLCQNYVEVAAGYMWFGDSFWKLIGRSSQCVRERMPAEVSLVHAECWKLRSQVGVFTDSCTAKLQEGVRSALFDDVPLNG